MPTRKEVIEGVVDDLIQRTRSGVLRWYKLNPSTYQWVGSQGKITIQKVSPKRQLMVSIPGIPEQKSTLILAVADSQDDERLSIRSDEESSAEAMLAQLFEEIGGAYLDEGVQFTRTILP